MSILLLLNKVLKTKFLDLLTLCCTGSKIGFSQSRNWIGTFLDCHNPVFRINIFFTKTSILGTKGIHSQKNVYQEFYLATNFEARMFPEAQ